MTVAKAMIMVVIIMASIMIACGINNSKTKTSTGISTSSNPRNLRQCHHHDIYRHRIQTLYRKKMEEQINNDRPRKTVNKVMLEVVLCQDGAAGCIVAVASAVIGNDDSEDDRPCQHQLLQLLALASLVVDSIVG